MLILPSSSLLGGPLKKKKKSFLGRRKGTLEGNQSHFESMFSDCIDWVRSCVWLGST